MLKIRQRISLPVNKADDQDFINNARVNFKTMLRHSREEYSNYKKTNNIIHLQQAGEKLFATIQNLIEYIEKRDYRSYVQYMTHTKSKELKSLLRKAKVLHLFFYGGLNDETEEEANRVYNNVYDKIKRKVDNM